MATRAPKRARSEAMLIRLTPEERNAVYDAAATAGQPIAWWVRRVLLAATSATRHTARS